MWYNSSCHTVRNGALFIYSADVNNLSYWAKFPVLLSNRSADCVTTSASNTGNFVMTKKDGKPCVRCGTSEWSKRGDCAQCLRGYRAKWNQNNPEKVREFKERWRRKYPEKYREEKARWRRKRPEVKRKNDRDYRERYPEKKVAKDHRRRTAKTKAGGSYTVGEWKALCEQYDSRCLCCGKKKALEFDHVIPVSKGGSSDISNGQPLCRSCNASKGDKTTDYRTKPGILRWIQRKLL
jgi:5-methylcytosine-specific restriction endonuclease McrA